MGCSCTNRESSHGIESKYLTPLEKDLKFHLRESKEIDRVFHRNHTYNKMNNVQLQTACRALGIDLERFQSFFDRFSANDYYDMKKLNCLGILLGKGTITEKVKLVFENSDLDTSKTLSREEIEHMIESLISVSCIIIPSYAMSINGNSQELEKYVQHMFLIIRGTQRFFTSLILEKRCDINLEEFQECFTYDVVQKLLSSRTLREYAVELYANVVKPAELVLETMDENFCVSNEFISRSNTMNTPKEGGTKKKRKKKKKKKNKKQYEEF